ncbi:hypothetical protein [Nostoc sp. KVJ3]|nr:hypothetical protein [Nostoc sp. KVJ3]
MNSDRSLSTGGSGLGQAMSATRRSVYALIKLLPPGRITGGDRF